MEHLERRDVPSVSISIGDATAIEGSGTLRFLDRFIPAGSGGLNRPRGLIFGPDGNQDGAQDLYVTDINLNAVLRYDGVTGSFLDTFVASTSGGLNNPGDVAFGPDGNLYVSSFLGNQVLRYDGSSGAFLGVVASGLASPLGLTFGTDGSLYIANQGTNEVLRYNGTGLSVFVTAGSGGLNQPRQGVFGPDGNLYVASQGTAQVLRYNGLTGAFLDTFASTNIGQGQTQGPCWLEFGTDGYLYTTARTTPSGLDTSIIRFNAATGAFADTLPIGRDSWSFIVGPGNVVYYSGNGGANYIDRFGPSSLASFAISLDSASPTAVTVDYSTANGTALGGNDYVATSGTLTFAPGQTTRTIFVPTIDDALSEPTETFFVNLSNPTSAAIADGQGVASVQDNDGTKFYVVNDGSPDQTYRYGAPGNALASSTLGSGDTAPRGAASTAAGTKVWVVDANKTVYVYDPSGGFLGSWAAGGLPANAQVEGLATNGTDIWVLDNKQDKVFKFTGAASRLSGSQSAASNFSLASADSNGKGIVTDGVSFWVVDDGSINKVFKYTLAGSSLGSWAIDAANASPTGLTINPANVSDIWVVDNGTDKVYQYTAAASRTSGSQNAAATFALAAGNTNPQDIADPPLTLSIGDATATEGSASLKFLDRFILSGSGGLSRPRGLIFGPDGNHDGAQDLYVTDTNLNAVLRYDGATGSFLDTFVASSSGGLNGPFDLAFGPDGKLYVTSLGTNQVLRYDGLSGAFFDVVTSGLSSPEGISFGSDGSLYIANQGTNEVLRYNGTGLSVFVTAGSGGLNQPRQGVFGPDGNLYVASQGTAQVLRYDGLTGAFIDTFASTNLGQGQTQGPIWLEFGTDGHLYTTARTNPVGGDTSIIRFNATTGAFADTLPIGRDSWSFIVGPGNVVYYSGNGGANYIERYGPSSLAAFTVSLDSPSVAPVTVQFTTADETALLGSDYVAATGTITFAPGETTRTVLVRTLDDALSEPAESFVVNLSNPVGATIADGQAVGTIADNEPLRVASAVVNGGAAQRSRVTDLTINFTGVATLPANPADAFRLTRTGPGTLTGDVTLSVDLSASTTTQTVARLTFGGSLTESGSLMDGTYTLTVLGGQVSGPGGGPLDGDGNGTPGGDSITTLHRLYGDVTGDRFVNGADFALFRTAFGTALGDAGYTPDLDLNGDGFVNGADFAAFRTRFGGGL